MKTEHVPLARYLKLWVAHAPGMPGTFFPPPGVNDPDMHHGTQVMHVPWWMSRSLTSCFLWCTWRGKCSQHSRHMLNPKFNVSGKRPMSKHIAVLILWYILIWFYQAFRVRYKVKQTVSAFIKVMAVMANVLYAEGARPSTARVLNTKLDTLCLVGYHGSDFWI